MNGKNYNKTSLSRWHGPQRRIGITGGIGSGKSSVGQFLKEIKGFPILDADVYAREALAPGQESTVSVLMRYGDAISNQSTNKQPTINRSALSKIIFSSPTERLWLEQLIHPIILMRLQKELDFNEKSPVVVLIIPLLFEAQLTDLCSEIWIVNCTPIQQCKRLMTRDGLSYTQAQERIQAQWPLEKKLPLADLIIDNSGDFQEWRKEVDKVC